MKIHLNHPTLHYRQIILVQHNHGAWAASWVHMAYTMSTETLSKGSKMAGV